jgi:hypothetical protein
MPEIGHNWAVSHYRAFDPGEWIRISFRNIPNIRILAQQGGLDKPMGAVTDGGDWELG